MVAASSLLRIDQHRAVQVLQEYLLGLLRRRRAGGVLLGLGGGTGSAILAALAVRSLGADLVHGTYLYDRNIAEDSPRPNAAVAPPVPAEPRPGAGR